MLDRVFEKAVQASKECQDSSTMFDAARCAGRAVAYMDCYYMMGGKVIDCDTVALEPR